MKSPFLFYYQNYLIFINKREGAKFSFGKFWDSRCRNKKGFFLNAQFD